MLLLLLLNLLLLLLLLLDTLIWQRALRRFHGPQCLKYLAKLLQ